MVQEQKNTEREMSDKCLESKRSTTAATMETQRGAKAPLVSSLSQESPPPPPPTPPNLPCCFPRADVVHLGSKDTNRQMKELLRKACLPSASLSGSLCRPHILRRSSLGSALLLICQAAYYLLPPDITSSQTSRLCRQKFKEGNSIREQSGVNSAKKKTWETVRGGRRSIRFTGRQTCDHRRAEIHDAHTSAK